MTSSQSLNRSFRAHPIRFPIVLIVFGAFLMAIIEFDANTSGLVSLYGIGLGVVSFLAGVIALPFGIALRIRRAVRTVPLVCPACGLKAANSRAQFSIERPGYLDYAVVTCPKCNWVFEAEKYAKFV